MFPASLLTALTALLLAAGGGAVAATDRVPRMERVASCAWDRPGHNPFTGDVVASIDRYTDIPTLVRIKLKQRMQARRYDDLVDIRRDEISGRERYDPTIRDMHFGADRVCHQVTRAGWSANMHERGLVYCESGHCILVPTVCRNVSRVTRRPAVVAGESLGGTPAAETGGAAPMPDLAGAPATLAPTPITSSFAEAVAGATVPLWDLGDPFTNPVSYGPGGSGGVGGFPELGGEGGDDDTGSGPDGPGGSGGSAGAGAGGGGGGGGGGGSGGGGGGGGGGNGSAAGGGSGGGGESGGNSGGVPGGGGWTGGDAGGTPGGGGLPISPIPEPSTWATLLAGLAALAVVSARRRGRRPAAGR